MQPYPNLSKAPIKEAILNVEVQASDLHQDAFKPFELAVAQDFPRADVLQFQQFRAEFRVDHSSVGTASQQFRGHICWNEARSRAVQARIDGFSVNHVKHYENWDALLGHARQWWPVYAEVVGERRVTKVSVRFINELELELGKDLSLSLRTRPEVSSGLPQSLLEYAERIVLAFPNSITGVIRQVAPAINDGQSHMRLVLDIDVLKTVNLEAQDGGLWSHFAELRDVKNTCFFESIQRSKWETYL